MYSQHSPEFGGAFGIMASSDASLVRPEPVGETDPENGNGLALFGIVFTVFALLAVCFTAPLGLPEFPDCPIQMLGSCGSQW